eukprot:comp21063_c0_seq2/m.28350 comp21063_c0_seq2/g.28350  ORF comp21063_c0_seq2/g.28350 comp21063_c0_seq2/m.28350 type:complete len:158 (-) comp21063_c0_seq2:438-911(-)
MSDGEVGKLQDAAKDRKARLLALRAQVKGEKRPHSEVEEEGAIKLRNYKPQNEDMAVGEPAAPEQPKLALVEQDKVDESEPFVDTVDITKLAPRKPTWDLKRDLEKKIQKLERRTQRAIAELVAERLRAQANGDLDSQVNAGAVAEQLGAVESDEEE